MEAQYLLSLLVIFLSISIYYNLKQKKMIREYNESESELIEKAYFDPITDMPNRKNIDIIIDDYICRVSRHKKSFLVLAVRVTNHSDIKKKSQNKANELIVKIADILIESIRNEDTPSRVSEDCFIVVFNEYLDNGSLDIPIKRVEQMLKGYEVKIGKSKYPNDSSTTLGIVENALNKTKPAS